MLVHLLIGFFTNNDISSRFTFKGVLMLKDVLIPLLVSIFPALVAIIFKIIYNKKRSNEQQIRESDIKNYQEFLDKVNNSCFSDKIINIENRYEKEYIDVLLRIHSYYTTKTSNIFFNQEINTCFHNFIENLICFIEFVTNNSDLVDNNRFEKNHYSLKRDNAFDAHDKLKIIKTQLIDSLNIFEKSFKDVTITSLVRIYPYFSYILQTINRKHLKFENNVVQFHLSIEKYLCRNKYHKSNLKKSNKKHGSFQ